MNYVKKTTIQPFYRFATTLSAVIFLYRRIVPSFHLSCNDLLSVYGNERSDKLSFLPRDGFGVINNFIGLIHAY